MSEQRLAGKVILVTASTRGIGLAIVRRCAAEGATVYMAARNMESAAARAAEINAQGGCVKTVYSDAYDHDSYTTMVEEVIKNRTLADGSSKTLTDGEVPADSSPEVPSDTSSETSSETSTEEESSKKK